MEQTRISITVWIATCILSAVSAAVITVSLADSQACVEKGLTPMVFLMMLR